MFALPWTVIVVAMVLAVVATFLAAGHPARAITRVPVVSALAGRPAPPRQIHRSFVPGVIALVIGFIMFSLSGAAGNGGGVIWLIPGFVALIAGIILVSPFFLALLARVGRKAPIAIRLALRDLSRYRARSGSALSAISVGVLIAVVICAVAVARYSNVFDYVGPNLASNELAVWSPNGQNGNSPNPSAPTPQDIASQEAGVHAIASAVGATDVVELDNPAPVRRPAEPQRLGPPVGRTDLRGDAGSAAGLRHQPVVHSVRCRRPQLAPRPLGLRRAADLRRRRKGRRPIGRPRRQPGRMAAGAPDQETRTPALPVRASPTRSSKKRANCPRARMRRTR